MNISGLGADAAGYLTGANDRSSAKVEQELNKDYSKASDEELMGACKQFESYLLEQVFKEMEKTIPKTEENENDSNSQLVDYFKESMTQQLAADSTEANGLGIAQTLYDQMKRNYSL